MVIALSPFLLSAQKTLIVCPNHELTAQVHESIVDVYSRNHALGDVLLWPQNGRAPGRAVQVDSINTRAESAYGFSD